MNPKIRIVGLDDAGKKIAAAVWKQVSESGKIDADVDWSWNAESVAAKEIVDDGRCDLLLLVAGLGRNYGSSAVAKVGAAARDCKIPVGAFVTFPFRFEGKGIVNTAEQALQEMETSLDFYNVFLCDDVMSMPLFADTSKSTVAQAFDAAEECVVQRIVRFLEIFNHQGKIVVDFCDALAILKKQGPGKKLSYVEASASGEKWTEECAQKLVAQCRGLNLDPNGAFVQVEHDPSLTLIEYSDIMERLYDSGCLGNKTDVIISDIANESTEKGGCIRMWC